MLATMAEQHLFLSLNQLSGQIEIRCYEILTVDKVYVRLFDTCEKLNSNIITLISGLSPPFTWHFIRSYEMLLDKYKKAAFFPNPLFLSTSVRCTDGYYISFGYLLITCINCTCRSVTCCEIINIAFITRPSFPR